MGLKNIFKKKKPSVDSIQDSLMSKHDRIQIPAMQHPGFRTGLAIQNQVSNRLLFVSWGGLGDVIAGEPTLRYALSQFRDCEISLASEKPELFTHLKFKEVFDLRTNLPNPDNYLVFNLIVPPDQTNLVWLFFSHMLTNCVDFSSMCALRCQLPVSEREVRLADVGYVPNFDMTRAVMVHPGKHWPSKTFPKDWWDAVIYELLVLQCLPVIIGANTSDNRGTVNVDTKGCIDLRNQTSIMECVSLLKQSRVLLTNDSSPLHMAADSDCYIDYIASCKHPDYITHWRRGQWGWRMKNHGTSGIWNLISNVPNKKDEVTAEFVDEGTLRSWLPDPKEYAKIASTRFNEE